jgi:hypothetical protein
MPGRDGTGPLGMGPCGKDRCTCRRKVALAAEKNQTREKAEGKAHKAPKTGNGR